MVARIVGDGWPRGLPFITHPTPQRPVFEFVSGDGAPLSSNGDGLVDRGRAGGAGHSGTEPRRPPASRHFGACRHANRGFDPGILGTVIDARANRLRSAPDAAASHETAGDAPHSPTHHRSHQTANPPTSLRRSPRDTILFNRDRIESKKQSRERSRANITGAEVNGASPRIQPPLHPSGSRAGSIRSRHRASGGSAISRCAPRERHRRGPAAATRSPMCRRRAGFRAARRRRSAWRSHRPATGRARNRRRHPWS